jgi:outer membrane protein assembly factor BamB
MKSRLLSALAVVAVGACGGNDTVEAPAELVAFDAVLDVREAWSRKVGDGSERLRLGLIPASDGTRVFAGALDGTASAIGLNDGELLWTTETGLALTGGPAVGNGLVVFGSRDGLLIALSADGGNVRWERPVGSELLAAPVIGGNLVVFRTVDGRLTAVSAETGEDVWAVVQTQAPLTLRGSTSPIIIGNTVIAGFDNGRVGAYTLADGVSRWEEQLSNPTGVSEIDRLVDVGVDIEVFGNDVYAANFQGRAAALILSTGDRIWEEELSSFTGLGVDASFVYVTDDVSTIVALSRSNGREVWRQGELRLRDVTAASRFRETVVVADFEGYLHWLRAADGMFMARIRAASAHISAQPLVVGSMVVIQSEDGTVAAFEVEAEEAEESEEEAEAAAEPGAAAEEEAGEAGQ